MSLDLTRPLRTAGAKLPVRVICADARLPGGTSIVALIEIMPGIESLATYDAAGKYADEDAHGFDLENGTA
ncbi:hypothetical protein [Emcibacter sp. SYSU 3D8]|uniref:hypothetical protein n=1 Tax=Emcibacter sp. SYSU 3D8 TaxID=3133969 RepID=UPI0031FE64F7